MTIGSAPLGEGPLRSDQDAKTWLCLQRQGRQSKQEAQGSRSVTVSRRDHLVQHAAGKTGPWKMSVDLGQAERECVWLSPEERGLQFCNGASQVRQTLAPGSARSLGLLVQGLLDRELAVFVVLLLGNDLAREALPCGADARWAVARGGVRVGSALGREDRFAASAGSQDSALK